VTSCNCCPKTTWWNYFMSEGLAGGDFCATRLPIHTTDYCLATKLILFLLSTNQTSGQPCALQAVRAFGPIPPTAFGRGPLPFTRHGRLRRPKGTGYANTRLDYQLQKTRTGQQVNYGFFNLHVAKIPYFVWVFCLV